MKKYLSIFFPAAIVSLAIALVPTVAFAASTLTGSNITLPKSETRNGTLYATGQTIVVDGNVNGDLVCAGQVVTVNGSVSGDILCAAQILTINGATAGNVRVMGQTVTLNGTIGKNLNVGAQTFSLGSQATVGGEAGIWADTAVVSAPVSSNLYGAMTNLSLESTVGGNVDVIVEKISLGSTAKIAGNLGYASTATYNINKSQVNGSIHRSDPPQGTTKTQKTPSFSIVGWFTGVIYYLVALLVIAIPLVLLAPKPLNKLAQMMLSKPGRSIGWGFVFLLLLPIIGIILLFTIVGIPLAVLLLVLWAILLGMTLILSGIVIGRCLQNYFKMKNNSLLLAALIGITTAVLVTNLPIVGFLLWLVALWWVTGGILLNLKYLR